MCASTTMTKISTTLSYGRFWRKDWRVAREAEGDASDLEANNSRPRKRRDSVGQRFIILIITLHLPWSSGGIFGGVDMTHSFSTLY